MGAMGNERTYPSQPVPWALDERGHPPLWAPWYGIGFGRAVARFWRKAFQFHGRASRSEYWWAYLFQLSVGVVVALAGAAIDAAVFGSGSGSDVVLTAGDAMTVLWNLAALMPSMAIAVRRLHDENLRGWWYLLPFALEAAALGLFIASIVVVLLPGGRPGVSAGLVVAAIVLYGAGLVLRVVLAVLPSHPKGARFDRPPLPVGSLAASGGMVGMDATPPADPFRPAPGQGGVR